MAVSKERWWTLPLALQLGSIGSEVGRARKWQGKDENAFWGAVTRALELFELTRADKRWNKRLSELNRAQEVFCDAVLGSKEYKSSLSEIEAYFMRFAPISYYGTNK